MTCLQMQMNQSVSHVGTWDVILYTELVLQQWKQTAILLQVKKKKRKISGHRANKKQTKVYIDRNDKNDSKLPQLLGH